MIRGTVSVEGLPTITLSIASQVWKATIDTGFNGDLELPEPLRNSLNARYVGQMTSALAGGKMLEEAVYLVDFPFDDKVIGQMQLLFLVLRCLSVLISCESIVYLSILRVERLNWKELSPDSKEKQIPHINNRLMLSSRCD